MKIFIYILIASIFLACGGTTSSESKNDSLLTSNISTTVLIVKGMKKDIKFSSSRKNITFKILNSEKSNRFSMTDRFNGVLTYWADNEIGTDESVTVEASDNNGWTSEPLTLKFKTVSKENHPIKKVFEIGDKDFTTNSDKHVLDSQGNIWENELVGKASDSNFYIMAKNRCEILRLTNKGTHWRIPTSDELLNLIDYSKTSGQSMLDDEFDSSNLTLWVESTDSKHLVVSQTNGLVFEVKSTDKYPVRCINSSKEDIGHVVSSSPSLKNTITFDYSTGLKWSSMSKDLYSLEHNASSYCTQYIGDNQNGWRLPNINEIRSVLENGFISTSIVKNGNVLVSSTLYNENNISEKEKHYVLVIEDGVSKIGIAYTDTLYSVSCVKKIEN